MHVIHNNFKTNKIPCDSRHFEEKGRFGKSGGSGVLISMGKGY